MFWFLRLCFENKSLSLVFLLFTKGIYKSAISTLNPQIYKQNRMSTIIHNRQPQICRLCLSKTITCFSLTDDGEIPRMLEALTSLKIASSDDISTISCLKCLLNLKLAFVVQQNMLSAEQRFQQRVLSKIKQEALPPCVDIPIQSSERSELQASSRRVKVEIEDNVIEDLTDKLAHATNVKNGCDICGSVSSSPRHKCNFNKTKNKNDLEKPGNIVKEDGLVCVICGIKTCSRDSLRQHKKNVHTSKLCPKCDKLISTGEFRLHMSSHSPKDYTFDDKGDAIYLCQNCPKTYKNFDNKCKHEAKCLERSAKLKEKKLKSEKIQRQKVHACDACDLVAPSRSQLHRHKYTVHLRQKCSICHKLIALDNLRFHMERHKNILAICEVCGTSVKSINLKAHIRTNHKNRTYGCKYCDRVFKFRQIMVHHQKKEHLNQADFVCDTCGKAFYKQCFLSKHIQSKHLKLRPHICQFCQVGFSTRYAMLTHQRKHTNETPYKCEVCGDGFRYKVTLKGHLKSKHDVEDELTCECKVCGKRFASGAALSSHGRIH